MYDITFTNFLLQKEATHRPLTTNTFVTKASPNTIITKAMTTNHAHEIPNTRHIIPNTRLLTPNHAIAFVGR
jgi:hypothetical protein